MSTFNPNTGTSNPFNGLSLETDSSPSLGDLDGDGDLDLVVGETIGALRYYRNTGTAIAPAYAWQSGGANPFAGMNLRNLNLSAPSLGDIDGDGDLDVVLGDFFGNLRFYKNTGTATAPAFVQLTGPDNPFDSFDIESYSRPSLGDIDSDGDLDLVVGDGDGTLHDYRNTGTATDPAFAEQTGTANPFSGMDVGGESAPSLGDIDGDGDLDLVVGEFGGGLNHYLNTGTATAPSYVEQASAADPSDNPSDWLSTPSLGDLDGDGDLDLVVGSKGRPLDSLQNASTALPPVYAALTGANNPLNGSLPGAYAVVRLGDIDGDGDLDLLFGELNGGLPFYRNTGTATVPAYEVQPGTANPFSAIDVGDFSDPWLADIDADGDLDLLVGEDIGALSFYRNTGTATAPAYTVQTGTANPFNGISGSGFSAPSLGDIDGDGDIDLVVGVVGGTVNYYRNTGSATAPAYAEQTGAANPFIQVGVGLGAVPSLADVDGDGDLDLVLGDGAGKVSYYRNTGTAIAPAYAEQSGTANPFNGVDVRAYSAPGLGDIDRDGDLDLFVGNFSGFFQTFIHKDAPTLGQAAFSLSGTDEETTTTAGSVSDLLTSAGWADVDTRALQGLAVTGSTGTGWQYSVNGSTWTPVGAVSNTAAVLLGATTQLRYTPDRANGETATLSFRAWDQTTGTASTVSVRNTANTSANGGTFALSSDSSTASLAVASVNDAPSNTVPSSIGVTEDVASALTGISVADVDAGANPLVMTLSVPAGTLAATSGSGVTVGGSAQALTLTGSASAINAFIAASQVSYTTAMNATGTVELTVSTNDQGNTGSGGPLTDTDHVNLTITAINDAPTTTPLTLPEISEDSDPFTITQATLLAGTGDVDGPNPLQAVDLQIATGLGILTSPTPGTWVYTPTPDDNGQVSFSFGISDGLATTPGTATLDISAVNDPPVTVADAAVTAAATSVVVAVLGNDSDVDGGPLTVSAVTQGSSGSTSIEPGSLAVRYTPGLGFSGFDTFTYSASDGLGGTAMGSVQVLAASHTGDGGNNSMFTTAGVDFVVGNGGNDYIQTFGGADYIDAGEGQDTVFGGSGADTQLGGGGHDVFYATSFELLGDSIDGGEGIDTLVLTGSTNFIVPQFSFSNLEQLSFSGTLNVDQTSLLDLSSLTLTGIGRTITGGFASNQIIGSKSNDALNGGGGSDNLNGSAGNDTVQGGIGTDTVNGGLGNDTLAGNTTAASDGVMDTFVFNTPLSAATNVDQILRFEANGIDRIALDSGIFAALGAAMDSSEFLASPSGVAVSPTQFILFDTSTGNLYYDADGSAANARVLFASLGTTYTGTVDAADFVYGNFAG